MSPLTQTQGQDRAAAAGGPPLAAAGRAPHRVPLQRPGALLLQRGPADARRTATGRRRCARAVEIEPAATAYAYRDYWGATVTAFDLHSPHAELVVTGTSIVEAGPDLAGHDRIGWSALAAREVREQFGELLSPDAAHRHGRRRRGRRRGTPSATPIRTRPGRWSAGSCASTWSTCPGSTNVKTNAMQAWTTGKGVCQDISHVTVGLLRGLGLPARYVSGYLHPKPKARDRRAGHRRESRLGGVVGRRLERLRPDQLRRDRHPARHPRPGPRLRRRPAVQGPVLRAEERGSHGDAWRSPGCA